MPRHTTERCCIYATWQQKTEKKNVQQKSNFLGKGNLRMNHSYCFSIRQQLKLWYSGGCNMGHVLREQLFQHWTVALFSLGNSVEWHPKELLESPAQRSRKCNWNCLNSFFVETSMADIVVNLFSRFPLYCFCFPYYLFIFFFFLVCFCFCFVCVVWFLLVIFAFSFFFLFVSFSILRRKIFNLIWRNVEVGQARNNKTPASL